MKASKAQSSIEYSMLTGFAFLFIIVLMVGAISQIKEITEANNFVLIKDMARKLQKEIVIAASVEDGYQRSFILPTELGNRLNYTIYVLNGSVTVESAESVVTLGIPQVNGTLQTGNNTIRKTNGQVKINI